MTPGFADAGEAQGCFRAVLRALSRPGEIVTIATGLIPPPPLSVAAAAILLTLADPATPVCLEGQAARDWLVFHTGAPLAAAETADFVVAQTPPPLSLLRNGSDDAPENGATMILETESFAGQFCRLTGPGLESFLLLELPLGKEFLAEWRAQSRIAPRGVDLFICCGSRVIGLPRSVHIGAV
jgi:alpha-D-ribose 1-methylphosphonate 5-triphosphate synthase subunit PhnH